MYSGTPVNEVDTLHLRPEIAPTSSAIFDEGKDSSLLEQKSDMIRRPTFSNASSVSVDQHYGLHIMLPASASKATVPASITSLRHCVVDMSIPTTDGKPYASLTAKGVKESLIICGQVDGPAHITGVEHSVIVVSCRQFRMHNCVDVDVYLSCTSNPIIEDCSRIRFSRIPRTYVSCLFLQHAFFTHLFCKNKIRERSCKLNNFPLTLATRHSVKIIQTLAINGTKLKISNGLNPNQVQIGVSLTPMPLFQTRYGQKWFPVALVGH